MGLKICGNHTITTDKKHLRPTRLHHSQARYGKSCCRISDFIPMPIPQLSWGFFLLHHPRRFHQQHSQQQRHDVPNHHSIKLTAHESFAVEGELINYGIRRCHPPYQYASANFEDGHHNIVADVIQQVQHLRLDTIGQIDLKIKNIVSEANHHSHSRYRRKR